VEARELARIVEFLNEQMTADVRAVELRYFEGAGGFRTLAPLIIGETERAQAQKSSSRPRLEPISENGWIQRYIQPRGPKVLEGFSNALRILRDSGAEIGVASTQGSLYAAVSAPDGKRLYPFHLQRNGTGTVSFGWVSSRIPDDIRNEYLQRFGQAVGPLTTANTNGAPAFPLDRLTQQNIEDAFRAVVKDWLDTCRSAD
jgi:hypothetical protein